MKTKTIVFKDIETFRKKTKTYKDHILKISLTRDVRIYDGKCLFYNFKKLKELSHFPENFQECFDATAMFSQCYSLNCDIDLSLLKSKNGLSCLFYGCAALNSNIKLNIISNERSFRMFEGCSSFNKPLEISVSPEVLKEINLSNKGLDPFGLVFQKSYEKFNDFLKVKNGSFFPSYKKEVSLAKERIKNKLLIVL